MWPFSRVDNRSAVIIDCSLSRVAGALVLFPDSNKTQICFSVEMPVHARTDETLEQAMLHALDSVGKHLIEQGAPALRRASGTGRPGTILVSIGAPWQKSALSTHSIALGKEFVVTAQTLKDATASGKPLQEGFMRLTETIISSTLNGYTVADPVGKRTKRAEFLVLSTSAKTSIIEGIQSRLRRLYHTHDISITSFAETVFSAIPLCYPHEKDYLVLAVSAGGSDLASIKNGYLVDSASVSTGLASLMVAVRSAERKSVQEELSTSSLTSQQPGYIDATRNDRFIKHADLARDTWVDDLTVLFRTFAEKQALPRLLFLIADVGSQDFLQRAIDTPKVHSLWLSDEPLTIVPLTAAQFASTVTVHDDTPPDVYLSMLARHTHTTIPPQ